MNNASIKIGYLPHDVRIFFGSYVIQTLPDFENSVKSVEARMDQDGYVYPRYPNQEGPSILFKLPETHLISTSNGYPLPENFREEDGAFILGLLSLFFETRLQFEGWWHESRIYAKSTDICLLYNGQTWEWFGTYKHLPDQLSELFDSAISKWWSFKKQTRDALLNSLYFHTKAPSYHWGYERFFSDYLALDSIWKAGEFEGLWKKPDRAYFRRKKRIYAPKSLAMILILGIYFEKNFLGGVNRSVKYCKGLLRETRGMDTARNQLFHEGKWDSNNRINITYRKMIVFKMHRFLQRLILGFCGIKNNYTSSPWWHMGRWSWK